MTADVRAARKRWQHPFQVVRMFRNGALIVCCSHRWEVTAGWCSDLRDALSGDWPDGTYHDVRATPEVDR